MEDNKKECTVDILAERINQLEKRILEKFEDTDLRYQQRFQAQTEAVSSAFAAQQQATTTAMVAQEKAVAAALAAADRAVAKAEAASERRFEAVNEFRSTLSDQATTFVTRKEVDLAVANLLDKIDGPTGVGHRLQDITNTLARGGGKEEQQATSKTQSNWSVQMSIMAIGIILTLVLSVIGLLKPTTPISYSQPIQSSQSSQSSQTSRLPIE